MLHHETAPCKLKGYMQALKLIISGWKTVLIRPWVSCKYNRWPEILNSFHCFHNFCMNNLLVVQLQIASLVEELLSLCGVLLHLTVVISSQKNKFVVYSLLFCWMPLSDWFWDCRHEQYQYSFSKLQGWNERLFFPSLSKSLQNSSSFGLATALSKRHQLCNSG